jgi:hypothetical protein
VTASSGRRRPQRAVRLGRRAIVVVLLSSVGACDAVTGSPPDDDGGIYVRYIGSESGVYDTYCFPVREEPEGRIVEIERIEDVNIIDATYEYLPDGLKILDPVSPVRFADCREYDLRPAPPPTTTSSTTTLPPPTVPPATVPATVPPPTAPPSTPAPLPTVVPPPLTAPATPPASPATVTSTAVSP